LDPVPRPDDFEGALLQARASRASLRRILVRLAMLRCSALANDEIRAMMSSSRVTVILVTIINPHQKMHILIYLRIFVMLKASTITIKHILVMRLN
jgi:hypothetical protein